MSKTIHDVQGINIGNKVAITIRNEDNTTSTVTGILVGIQGIGEAGYLGLQIKGLTQWIWIEDNMTVTWGENK